MYRSIGIWVRRLIDTKQWPFASAFAQNSHSALFLCLTLIDHETVTLLFSLCLFLFTLELESVPFKPSLSVPPESEFPGDCFPIKDLVTQCCAFLHATAGFFGLLPSCHMNRLSSPAGRRETTWTEEAFRHR